MAKYTELKKSVISATIDSFILKQAKEYAESEHRSLSSLIEHLLAVYLINEKKKENGNKEV